MNTETFLENFHTIANAPGGIARLREMILQLAVQGKLVEQNPNDEPASELLKKIEAEKEKLAQGGKIKKKSFDRTKYESQSFSIPENWTWSSLNQIGEINPRNEAPDNLEVSFVPMSGISQLYSGSIIAETRLWGSIKQGFTHFAEGDIVLAKITPCFENGKAVVMRNLKNGIGAGTTELHVCRPILKSMSLDYIFIFLKSPYFSFEGQKNMTGTAGQKRLPTDYFATKAFPLPPLSEQKRIVAKVDSLMALCDRLESLQKKKVELNSLTRKTAFTALGNANEPSELKSAWARVEENTQYLLDSEEAVEEMKKTILQNAIKGNLVPQDPNNEPASELLKKIEVEKESLTTKSAKEEVYLDRFDIQNGIANHSYKNSIPTTWHLMKFQEVATIKSNLKNPKDYLDLPHVAPNNIEKDTGKLMQYGSVREDGVTSANHLFYSGQILYSKIRPKLNKLCIVDFDGLCSADMYPIDSKIFTQYLKLFMLSDIFLEQSISEDNRIAMPKINQEKLNQILVFVPPLEEQKRIVEKVDSLFAICDRLQKQLATAKTTAANLAKAAVESLTGIQSTEKEKMKAPKTELVSILRLSKAPTVKDKAPLSAILLKHKESMSAKNLWLNSGMEIDQFYQQLKTEMANGWIVEPEKAYMQVVE